MKHVHNGRAFSSRPCFQARRALRNNEARERRALVAVVAVLVYRSSVRQEKLIAPAIQCALK